MTNIKGFKAVFDLITENKNKVIDVSYHIGKGVNNQPISVNSGKLTSALFDESTYESGNILTLYFGDHFLEVSDDEFRFEIGESYTNNILDGQCVFLSFKDNDDVFIWIEFR